ncbi:hypothetical protein EMIHUDRAFT_460772, partial [Emiliania huxleyi CCMP1516]|uniref:Uncharacterized protein n=2 Tax=Emiliania huxleyi TaxID=2903 RepID=A0A0D3JIL6_EMIH1
PGGRARAARRVPGRASRRRRRRRGFRRLSVCRHRLTARRVRALGGPCGDPVQRCAGGVRRVGGRVRRRRALRPGHVPHLARASPQAPRLAPACRPGGGRRRAVFVPRRGRARGDGAPAPPPLLARPAGHAAAAAAAARGRRRHRRGTLSRADQPSPCRGCGSRRHPCRRQAPRTRRRGRCRHGRAHGPEGLVSRAPASLPDLRAAPPAAAGAASDAGRPPRRLRLRCGRLAAARPDRA